MRSKAWLAGAAAAAIACLPADAARRLDLRFVRPAELPSIGLRIDLMAGAHEAPLPPPTMVLYEFRGPDGTRKVEMYTPAELWRRRQCAGRWVDESGNAMTVAAVRDPLPRGFPRAHVSLEEFDAAASQAAPVAAADWTPAALQQWVADFAGAAPRTPEPVPRPPSRYAELRLFRFEGRPPRLAYAFRLNPRAAGFARAPAGWFVLLLELNPEIDMARAEGAVAEELLPKLGLCSTAARAAGEAVVLPRGSGAAAGANRSPEFLASRLQVAESVRNMKDWWFAETPSYIVLANLRTRSSSLVRRLQSDLEVLRAGWEKAIPPRKPLSAVSVIRVFATGEEYESYVGPDHKWTSGLWAPGRRELIIRSFEGAGNEGQRDAILRIVYHEAFHQYLFYAFDQVQASAWFNEGHAAFFENAQVRSSGLDVGEDPQKAAAVDEMIRAGTLRFADLVPLSYEAFYGKDDETRRRNYSAAWALVYWLRKGTGEGKVPYAGILPAYADALWTERSAERADERAFRGVDTAALQEEFVRFWKSSSRRGSARRGNAL